MPAPTTPTPQTSQANQAPSSSTSHLENPISDNNNHNINNNNNNNSSNNDDTSPQSPPLQPPPLTSAGPRATALNRIFSEALSHSLRTCTYANFAACFPTPAACEPDALRELWRMFGRELEERCRASYDAILTSRAVIPSLNELDRLIADARKRKESHGQNNSNHLNSTQIPPHTLPPQTLYTAHLRPFLQAQSTALHERAASIHERNDGLASRIQEQRDEMDMLVRQLEVVVKDLEGAAGLVGSGHGGVSGGGKSGEMMDTDMIERDEIRQLEGW